GLAYLRMLCEQIQGITVVKSFNDPVKLLEESPDIDFDLCILDIEMPGINGLELARSLKNKPVIFITAYKEYAAEAYDLEAIDYICKPVRKERLEKAIAKAMQLLTGSGEHKAYFQVNSDKGKTILFFDRIVYITVAENDKRDKIAYLDNGRQLLIKNISFEKLLEQLPESLFCRVNKRDIISLGALLYFSHDEIVINLKNSDREEIALSLSDTYRSHFLQQARK
ncbi:MAG TPA: response regulator transcription factor, partial [Chitinophagaceae bacterium]